MSGEITAENIMTREVITVSPDDDVQKAANLLLEHNISGLPVIDGSEKVVGVLSEADLIIRDKEFKGPSYINFLDGIIYLENPLRFQQQLKKMTEQKVKGLMTSRVFTANPDTPVEKIVAIITDKKVNRVPVVNPDGKLLGIVTRHDILKRYRD